MRTIARKILVGVSCMVLTLGGFVGTKAQKPVAPMDGDWVNVDSHTRGIVRLTLKGNTMHAFGSCHPKLCDWGEVKGKLTDDAMRYTAKFTDRVGTRMVDIYVDNDDTMSMRLQTHYPDGRFGPDDVVSTFSLQRQPAP